MRMGRFFSSSCSHSHTLLLPLTGSSFSFSLSVLVKPCLLLSYLYVPYCWLSLPLHLPLSRNNQHGESRQFCQWSSCFSLYILSQQSSHTLSRWWDMLGTLLLSPLSLPVAYGSPGALWPRLLLLKHGQHLTSCLSVGSSTFYYYLLFKITLLVLRGCKFALNLSRIVLNWFFKYDHKLFIYFLQNSTLRGYKHDLFKNVSLFLDTKFVSILGL